MAGGRGSPFESGERYESPLGSCRKRIPLHLRIDGEFNILPPFLTTTFLLIDTIIDGL